MKYIVVSIVALLIVMWTIAVNEVSKREAGTTHCIVTFRLGDWEVERNGTSGIELELPRRL